MKGFQARSILLTGSMALLAIYSLAGDSAQTVTRSQSQGDSMKQKFVFIFRQGSRKLSDDEQKRRTDEVRAWVLEQIKQGHNLEPCVLGVEAYRLGEDAGKQSNDGLVIALNFIEATDFAEAVNIAKTHPGLRYGVVIEVRPWRDPRAQP